MKTFINTLLVAIMASVTLTSCLGDDKKMEYSDDCFISSFAFGTLKQVHHITGSNGQDSIYYTSFTGINFPMSINQRTLHIENPDSLPYGVMPDKVLTTCTFEKILVHRPHNIEGLEPVDTAWVTYSAKDTIDFTYPRDFLVLAADGNNIRQYTVQVNIHQMNPEETVWDSLGVSSLVMPAQCEVRKMMVVGDELMVYTQTSDGSLACFSRAAKKAGQWKQEVLSQAEGLEVTTLCMQGQILYASTKDGKVLYSVDGKEWQTRLNGQAGLRLLGVSESYIYALVDGKLMSSPRSSEAWTGEELDDEFAFLPEKDVTLLSMTQKNGNKRLLLAGKSADGKTARLWSKSWAGNKGSEGATSWVYYSENAAIKNTCPVIQQPNMMPYDKGILLFGGAPEINGKPTANLVAEPLGRLYFSQDYGITWQKHSVMQLKDALTFDARKASFITAAVEDGRFVWILVDGQLWRGRLNSVIMG